MDRRRTGKMLQVIGIVIMLLSLINLAVAFVCPEYALGATRTVQRDDRNTWYITESGYIATTEEDSLDRAIFWAGLGSEQQFMQFVESNDGVFPLRGGLRVRIVKFSFSGKVLIQPEGHDICIWTVREAIRMEVLHVSVP